MVEPTESAEISVTARVHRVAGDTQSPQAAPAVPSPTVLIDDLLLRMRAGDREAAADFLMRYGTRIRRRIRGKLGPSIRRLFDSMEILSTVGRRLDLYVMSGRLQVANEAQLWSLLFRMADRALIDKARLFQQLQSVEGEDGEFAQQLGVRLRQAEAKSTSGAELEIDNCLRALPDAIDRRILSMWLSGEPHTAIAQDVELTATAVRKRWEKIKSHLKDRFEDEVGDAASPRQPRDHVGTLA